MSLFLPGAASLRTERTSQLMFHYRAADATVDALSGQPGAFSLFILGGYIPSTITGQNNVTVSAGHGLPRFDQAPARGAITRLLTEGEVAAQDSENITWDFPLLIQPLTMFWRVYPVYAPGANVAVARYGPTIGNNVTLGGWLSIRRLGTDWQASRLKGATEIVSVVSAVGEIYPVDLLLTITSLGALTLSIRDAAGIRVGTTGTNIALMNQSETWSAGVLSICGIQGLVAPGGQWYHEILKVARGVKTFAEMDKLS